MTGTMVGTLGANRGFQMGSLCAAEPQIGGARTSKLPLAGAALRSQTGCTLAETGTATQIGKGMTRSRNTTVHAMGKDMTRSVDIPVHTIGRNMSGIIDTPVRAMTGAVSSSAIGIETGGVIAPEIATGAEADLPAHARQGVVVQILISKGGAWSLFGRLPVQSLCSMKPQQRLPQNMLQSLRKYPLHRHP